MNILEIIISSLALASDAFAVSISKGLSSKEITIKNSIIVGLWFGLFQMIMPLIGYFLGVIFNNIIFNVDHFISFILLIYIGINMINESNKKDIIDNNLNIKTMIILSIATSIDALSYGIAYSLGYSNKNALLCFIIIGIITFITSFYGYKLGNKIGNKYEKLSKRIGGVILILLGCKILFEHLFII